MEPLALARLTTLGHAGRMSVFRLLMRRYPQEVPAGEIAAALGLKASTLSVYLAALMEVSLVAQHRVGRSLRYRARLDSARALGDFLLADCCRGRLDLCAPALHPAPARRSVLFLCTGNSARSLFAEAILRTEAGARFKVCSAGTRPFAAANAHAMSLLRAKGHDVSALRPKHVGSFREDGAFDFVFTVCDRAANEDCPAWPGQPVTAHWGVPDPVTATGTEAERRLAFQQAYGALANRIAAFAALPMDTLDRAALQSAVDHIALMGAA